MPSRAATILTVLSLLTAGQAIAGRGIVEQAMAFDLEAHRGGRALLPENTLPAFANALSMGVDTLELDVGVTADGEIVVSHERGLNPDLTRRADGTYITPPGTPFVKLRLDEVRTYDVGQIRPDSAYAKQFPDQRALPGTRIPTLRELFALGRKSGNARVRFNIETKIDPNRPDETLDPQAFVAKLLALIETEALSDRVMIQSFDWRTLQLVQQQAPKMPTVYLTLQRGSAPTVAMDKATNWTAGFNPADHGGSLPRTIKAAGGAIWSPHFGDVTAALVAEAHGLGLRVVVWTVNKREDMTRMIELGVDGIISDKPDLLRQVAGEKGITLPAGTPVAP
ncbi:glycerophosphodiester phosphodiesterase [Bradyrhizobium sp. WBOS7]|uniref:Glycerophosphodiester phosphodiesterase n=1 Tax=Bradyrhizobium betae TaxID=244734 RepID=A0AAE9NIF4_9BRAD|nr:MULTISPECIES: glycerophosphodiester phosphodiesterase [Bradyrhizobium]MDD1574142.1 glycerophosphodiester phosphodiesterase [Bradyrhizobium sp. WBOS1]UUO38586.1 glycerophosphodiester phosphodiesterase [Bradyrhizobium sp. WBOS01]MDD1530790.1 glycerophosphodiester phosphodiesterase [Bradyrhizobium sp. WBOS2]MDD1580191.1 glycerophosphodiester phosphodiesterase [Bradyrhizobium sp. WBOS7]MDD1604904.1 glycerophosphodiester phosphodiesterase [Bradyrhizobium sp. WBOS16]